VASPFGPIGKSNSITLQTGVGMTGEKVGFVFHNSEQAGRITRDSLRRFKIFATIPPDSYLGVCEKIISV
jgi:hypothetical protein